MSTPAILHPVTGKPIKLGKKPAKLDPRTLKLSKYTASLPAPPPAVDWTKGVTSFGEMLNNELGCCTCAAVGHGIQIATLNSPANEVTPPDSLILQLYERACGYVPGDPSTDQGGVIIDVLNYVRNNHPGQHLNHHKHKFQLVGYADPNPGDITHIKQAINTFGIDNIGVQLPISAQAQVGKIWTVTNRSLTGDSAPGSWGGHSLVVVGYTPQYLIGITWGQIQFIDWGFWETYVDESHCLLFLLWKEQYGPQFAEILAQMEADLALITN
jgi:hypothetical protein